MPAWSNPLTVLEAGLSVALLLLAAKAHGRQVRLERELEGHMDIVFGGDNPPFVEQLWHRDRIRFWSVFPSVAALSGASVVLRSGIGGESIPLLLLEILLWSPVVAFAFCGLLSFWELRRRLASPSTAPGKNREPRSDHELRVRPEWLRDAQSGSTLYWIAVGALAGAIVLMAVIGG